MRYLRLFESFEDIDEIYKKYGIYNYIINSDGSIDVDGNVDLSVKNLTKLPLKFNKVNGDFICSWNNLESLEGSTKEVNGSFYCNENKLTSFVKRDFICFNNPIHEVWILFKDWTKIELLNDFDIFRDEDTDEPKIFIDRLNDFLEMIGKDPVESIDYYKNI